MLGVEQTADVSKQFVVDHERSSTGGDIDKLATVAANLATKLTPDCLACHFAYRRVQPISRLTIWSCGDRGSRHWRADHAITRTTVRRLIQHGLLPSPVFSLPVTMVESGLSTLPVAPVGLSLLLPTSWCAA